MNKWILNSIIFVNFKFLLYEIVELFKIGKIKPLSNLVFVLISINLLIRMSKLGFSILKSNRFINSICNIKK